VNRDILLTGTPVVEQAMRRLRAGRLEAQFGADGLRWVLWNGVEVLRAVQFLVRMPGWGTAAPVIMDLQFDEDATRFNITCRAHYGPAGAGLMVDIVYCGSANGRLTATADICPEVTFDTNRTGFVILHPLTGFAGTEVLVDHASVPQSRVRVPLRISPGQPILDIRAITHQPVPGLTVETRFDGDVFEMEDQRNWSDASFKTYSRPLDLPYPYQLLPGVALAQSVTVTIADAGANGPAVSMLPPLAIDGQFMPDYALPLDRLSDATEALLWSDALLLIAPQWILLRWDPAQAGAAELARLARLLALTKGRLDLMIILASTDDVGAKAEIAAIAQRLGTAAVKADRVSAFAKIDAQSFQPGQSRPPHPGEAAIAASLARHFATAMRLGGTPAFFTEFNRKRPDPSLWDGLRFATTPVVHAADDASVMETLQALPDILGSAAVLAAGRALAVGPTGIGARLNPYGPTPNVNDPAERIGMAARDPRQRGLFAAAWTVGYLAQIAPFAPGQFAFGAPTGPFGLVSTRQSDPRAFWDDMPDGALYPLYHVARWIAAAAGAEVVSAGIERGVAQIVWRRGHQRQALLANLTPDVCPMPNPGFKAAIWLLDAASLQALAQTPKPQATAWPQTLDAYAIAFLDEEGVDT
jgi:hypothetical protein